MIDPMVSTAFSVYSLPGAYALLIGSGVSRAAGVPTGWEVVGDLISKVAHLSDEPADEDPAAWYRGKFGKDPEYSELLDQLARTPAERRQILRAYFEPSVEERDRGEKVPTAAHRAIANLVSSGFIKVILTTNFDRLIERAIEDAGITPVVVSTTDAVQGMLPMQLGPCVVIKLHGDYLDTRIKNTSGELESYDPEMNELLSRVLDEYGLIVCGWSADWDPALCSALERCASHRFTTFWTFRSDLRDRAKRLAENRRATLVNIEGADQFFQSLEEKVLALEARDAPHPLSAAIAAETVKRYLVDDRYRIRLHDLITAETERVLAEIEGPRLKHTPPMTVVKWEWRPEELVARLHAFQEVSQVLRAAVTVGAFWDRGEYASLWVQAVRRLASPAEHRDWTEHDRWASLTMMYSAGVAAIASGNYVTVNAILTGELFDIKQQRQSILWLVTPQHVLDQDDAKRLPGRQTQHWPVSEMLFESLRPELLDLIPDDHDYDAAFNGFELLAAMVYADLDLGYSPVAGPAWVPPGRYAYAGKRQIVQDWQEQLNNARAQWPPIAAGMFGGSEQSAHNALVAVQSFINQLRW